MSLSSASVPRKPLTATYRLQMNAGFTLEHARARIAYFDQLGISHLYLSPILAARRGSHHGYDVVDPTRVNPELGTEDDLRALANNLHARGMGLIIDIVPNHMGVCSENPYWDDVLAHGERSPYAKWFDIEWTRPGSDHRKLVLPILGDDLARVLERGELSLRLQDGETPRIVYFGNSFPVEPASLPPDLQLAQVDPEEAGEIAKMYSGAEGAERMRALLDAQHYTLAFWRTGTAEINYRRFFDVNDLAAVRVEEPAVFDATHALILRWVREGLVDGLRVDHIDGLLDPAAYLARLRAATSPETLIFVEKILAADERLPASWPVQGTTGYEFLNDVENVFLDPEGTVAVEGFYRRLRRLGATTFDDVARAGKRAVLEGALRSDLDRVSRLLIALAKTARRRWTSADVTSSLTAFVAALPVYRTYIDGRSEVSPDDRAAITRASAGAIESGASRAIVEFIAATLLGETGAASTPERLAFAQRLQQLSGPAAAKGVEDTALYVFVPVTSRAEVGAEPDQPLGGTVDRLHRANMHRAEQWPASLLATTTHDTKRSADVRARLDALTELPHDWERAVRRWRRLNAKHRCVVKGRLAPDTNTEYLMYQIIVALWPPPRAGRRSDDLPDRAWRDLARERLTAYALKAAREAKIRTSWIEPNAAYEGALTDFVSAILEPSDDAPFLADVARLVARIAGPGAWNSLSRVAIHLTAPGTTDVYQGDEIWNFSLVDPDNRRPVDYETRAAALEKLDAFARMIQENRKVDVFDNRIKLLLTQRLLHLRGTLADVFTRGRYDRLAVRGPRSRHVVAFARTSNGRQSITIGTRLLGSEAIHDSAGFWRDTVIEMASSSSELELKSAFFGSVLKVSGGRLDLAQVLDKLPVAVLTG